MTKFGARRQSALQKSSATRDLSHGVLIGIDNVASCDHGLRLVKIAHFPRRARDSEFDCVGTVASAVHRARLDGCELNPGKETKACNLQPRIGGMGKHTK
jgi:hypothetical protein